MTTSSPSKGLDNKFVIFPESSFFKERRASSLPTPAEVRAANEASGNIRARKFNRPPPVVFPSLELVVKYGSDVTIVEANTQLMIREQLQGRVHVPEVFGWAEDRGQGFIYMSLIKGSPLQERWGDLSEDERQAVCEELRDAATAWRALEQDEHDCYIGSLDKQPLKDICFISHPELAGPFTGPHALQRFQDACDIEISGDAPIVFTHNDLVAPNILLSPGPNPKVAAIIDWGQAGWYPAYWEYCKARWIKLYSGVFDDAAQEAWHTKYLGRILDPVDTEACYYPWLYFALSKGI